MMRALTQMTGWAGILLAALAVSACGGGGGSSGNVADSESDPVEEVTPADRPDRITLEGRVIDGYLRHAKVWIDVNSNFVHDANEPFTMTGKGGEYRFTLADTSAIGLPDKYPLVATAERGTTVDESRMTDGVEETGAISLPFILTAPAGVTNVTPLTTLVRMEYEALQRDQAVGAAEKTVDRAQQKLQTALRLTKVDLAQDFIATKNAKLEALAKGLVATLQLNLRDMLGAEAKGFDQLRGDQLRQLIRALHAEAVTVQEYVAAVVGQNPTADAASAADFLSGQQSFNYPKLWPALEEKKVLHTTRWFVNVLTTHTDHLYHMNVDLPLSELKQVATVTTNYSVLGNVLSSSVDGWLLPVFTQDGTGHLLIDFHRPSESPLAAVDGKENFRVENTFKSGHAATSKITLGSGDFAPPALKVITPATFQYGYGEDSRLLTINRRLTGAMERQTFSYTGNKLSTQFTTPSAEDSSRSKLTEFVYVADKLDKIVESLTDADTESGSTTKEPLAATIFEYDAQGRERRICKSWADVNKSGHCWRVEHIDDQTVYRYFEDLKSGETWFLVVQTYGPLANVAR